MGVGHGGFPGCNVGRRLDLGLACDLAALSAFSTLTAFATLTTPDIQTSAPPNKIASDSDLASLREFAAREVDRVVDDLAITSVIVRPNPVDGRPVGHPDHEPFWARCEERGVSVSLHEGCHTMLPAAGADRFTSHFAMHACCHPIEQMMAFVSLVESGTFERHPDLRVGFMESGGGWVPYLLWRLDDLEYKHWRFQVPEVKRKPSEYFHRQCYVSVEACEPYLPRLVDELGADRLLFATDFPHPDHTFGEEIADTSIAAAMAARDATAPDSSSGSSATSASPFGCFTASFS